MIATVVTGSRGKLWEAENIGALDAMTTSTATADMLARRISPTSNLRSKMAASYHNAGTVTSGHGGV